MAKTIPVVGEAFLGSDPLVPRVLKVTYGVSSAVVDVTADSVATAGSAAAYNELVNFADSGYIITNMIVTIEEAFSNGVIEIGQDSSAVVDAVGFFPDGKPVATVLGGIWNAHEEDSSLSLPESSIGTEWYGVTDTLAPHFTIAADCSFKPWPVDSDDTIRAIFDSGVNSATQGKMALYVYYQAL